MGVFWIYGTDCIPEKAYRVAERRKNRKGAVKNKGMKKILTGFIMDGKSGGIDKYLLNFLQKVQERDVRVDFLTNEIDLELEESLKKYQSRIFAVSNLKHPVSQYRQVRSILQRGQYDMVYLNISTAIDCIAAIAAKHSHVERILVHSHSSGNDCENVGKRIVFNGIHAICRLFLYRYATEYYGCSYKAGEWMFPEKIVCSEQFQVIYNAVDREQFELNRQIRESMRRELGIQNRFVVGNVGNLCYQKNQFFLLDIFKELYKKEPRACLIIVGDGVRFQQMKDRIRKSGLEDAVLLLGRRSDVANLYQAMDVFVLPSNFEGLPIAGIEAQSAGLPCIMSDTITKEGKIVKECRFISLHEKPEKWADEILQCRNIRKEAEFLECAKNYDLKSQQKQLLELLG